MVVIPLFADQLHNANRLTATGVGVRVDADRVAACLTPTVELVLSDPSYRTHALGIAAEIATRPTPGEALDRLRGVVVG